MSTPEDRKAIRVRGTNGRWYALDARQHGVSSAWSYWFCECSPCIDGRAAVMRESRFRRHHNRRILEQIQHDHTLQRTPALESVSAPEPRELEDEAGGDGSPSPASALAPPTAQSAVLPTQLPAAPGPPASAPTYPYLDQVRARLRAAGLGA